MEKEGCSGFKVYFLKVLFFYLKIQERGEIILNLFTRSLKKDPTLAGINTPFIR